MRGCELLTNPHVIFVYVNINFLINVYCRVYVFSFRYLNYNNIPVVHHFEFKNLITEPTSGRFELQMTNCGIERLEGSPFSNLSISHLLLSDNHLTDESMETGLDGIESLEVLDLTDNCLESVPHIGLHSPLLQRLFLTRNNISSLTRSSFTNMTNLKVLHLSRNPLSGFSADDDTFAEAEKLQSLEMEYTSITQLPNLLHLPNLHELIVNQAKISSLSEGYCSSGSELSVLEVNHNRIKDLPLLNCRELVDFEIAQNELTSVHPITMRGMTLLNKLDISDNSISYLHPDIFTKNINMEYLRIGGNLLTELPDLSQMVQLIEFNASHNRLQQIHEGTFTEQVGMDLLYLNDNDVRVIDGKAFTSPSDLKRFNLSNNVRLHSWTLPRGGFPLMETLEMQNLWDLHQVPSQYQIPRANFIYFTYSYHCCVWKNYIIPVLERPDAEQEIIEQYDIPPTDIIPTAPPEKTGCTEHIKEVDELIIDKAPYTFIHIYLTLIDEDCRLHIYVTRAANLTRLREEMEGIKRYIAEHHVFVTSSSGFDYVFEYLDEVVCKPAETPLTPCQNLMHPWALRVAIWAVWVIALLGNITVLFVGIVSKEKLEPSEFLVCNLAFADLCMGLYLVFLATVDVRTFGSGTFYQSALDWQLGAGCESAGFIAIFSNELSVFILVILTLERVYTIASAFNQDDVRKKRVAMVMCAVGWFLAILLATLPLVGINSYNRVAVCLPYVTETFIDKLYIGIILTGNMVGFVIILLSYVYIFTSACRNTPATYMPQRRKDILIAASKIAVLILTAFFCWAPTALIGFLALAGVPLVTAAQAKYFLVFVIPLNACVNPFIYAIFTSRFRQKFATIFQRSNDKVTSFPPHHSMRLRRTASAFNSEVQTSRMSSSQSRTAEELTKMRQSRRSNSLVVQFVENVPSPTFTPPVGCNLGRRASLPPGFGSTLNTSGHGHRSLRSQCVPHCVLPFRLGSQYSSNTSSLPDLQEEGDSELDCKSVISSSPMDSKSHPLTSSQESNLRRLSVVKEDDAESEIPNLAGEQEDDDTFSDSSLDDYVDAHDSIQYMERVTDLDHVIHKALCSNSMPQENMSENVGTKTLQDSTRERTRKCSYEYAESDIIQPSTLRRKSSSWSDILSLNDCSLSPLQTSVFATVEERFNTPLFASVTSSPNCHLSSFSSNHPQSSATADYISITRMSSSEPSSSEDHRLSTCTTTDTSEDLHRPGSGGGHLQNVIYTTTDHQNRDSSSSTFSDQFTGIRQDIVSSSTTTHPSIMHSTPSTDTPDEHTSHHHLNNYPSLLSSSPHDDTTDSCTSINIETHL